MANRTKTLEHFRKQLTEGESVLAPVLYGTYKGKILGKEALRRGILVATNQRVVFFSKKLFGYEMDTFFYNRISSISESKSPLGDFVLIHATGNTAHLKWIRDCKTKVFVQFVNEQISNQ